MQLLKGIHAVDLTLLLGDTLIISDVHIGFEEALNKQGMMVPRDHFPQLIARMEGIFARLQGRPTNRKKAKKLRQIIVNGDLKHEFGTISEQEWRHTLKFLDFLKGHCEKIILVRGNHDTILGPIARKRGIEVHDHFFIEGHGALVCHGDKLPSSELIQKSKMIIIGHEHPSVALRSGSRVEKYKCFYVGQYQRRTLIVLPSLNLLTEGNALMHDDVLSPFLKQRLDDFEVFAVEDKVYRFGKLGRLRKKDFSS
ncbi:metallophosphoesterase [Candidatus Woesearchaeota archaeon]|nr:metallophosphoesterase [Candidatus Woesearchaeota archaeon]